MSIFNVCVGNACPTYFFYSVWVFFFFILLRLSFACVKIVHCLTTFSVLFFYYHWFGNFWEMCSLLEAMKRSGITIDALQWFQCWRYFIDDIVMHVRYHNHAQSVYIFIVSVAVLLWILYRFSLRWLVVHYIGLSVWMEFVSVSCLHSLFLLYSVLRVENFIY